jgi:hypothetical protein
VIAASGGFSAAGSELERHLLAPGWRRAIVDHDPPPPIPPAKRRTIHGFDTDRLQGGLPFAASAGWAAARTARPSSQRARGKWQATRRSDETSVSLGSVSLSRHTAGSPLA